MVIYVPLVWIRNMEKLAFTHLISDVVTLFVIVSILALAGINLGNTGEVYVTPLITPQFYNAFSYSAFAFEGIAVVLPLKDIVADKAGYYKLLSVVVAGICAMFILFSLFTGFAYDFAKPPGYVLITDALSGTSVFTWVLKSLYTINLFFTYPLQLSPAVNLVESFIFDAKSAPTTTRYWMQNLIRTLMVVFTIVLALSVYS